MDGTKSVELKNLWTEFPIVLCTCCTICSGMSWVIGVSVNPGRTALHLIPNLQRNRVFHVWRLMKKKYMGACICI